MSESVDTLKMFFITKALLFHGLAAIVIGSYTLQSTTLIEYFWDKNYDNVGILCVTCGFCIIVLGVILAIFSIGNHTAQILDNILLIVLGIVIYSIFVASEIYIGLALLSSIGSTKERMVDRMKLDFKMQNVLENPRMNSFHILEKELKCCGIEGTDDYMAFQKFPMTCCYSDIPCYRGLDTYNGCRENAESEIGIFFFCCGIIYCIIGLIDLLGLMFLILIAVKYYKKDDECACH